MTDQSDMNHAPRTPQRRRALLHGVVGVPAPWSEAVAKTLTGVALRDWDDEVAPLIARHWPEAKGAGLVERLRGEACHLHAPRAFLALLVSAHRPPVLQAVALLERVPAARVKEYARAARVGFGLLRRAAMRDQSRRTTLAAALVAVLGVGHDADADLASLLDLSWRPDRGPLRVARELLIKLESGLSLGARERFLPVADSLAALPAGPAEAAATATATVLAAGLEEHLDASSRRFLVAAARATRLAFAWNAREAADGDATDKPTLVDVDAAWQDALAQLVRAARDGGLGSDAARELVTGLERRLASDAIDAFVVI
ncbi:MAG: hypothetical protein KC635_12775 [Myxococcales bacterium]|nr:hypothetical protein [Myxococcales bacterium]MCB9733220.1 hypothetical protein [Deltaproteobacteria bacterium]